MISASIMGCQYEVCELLAKDSYRDEIQIGNSKDLKYIIHDSQDEKYFQKSRSNKDDSGNNCCHLAFEMVRDETRYQFLELLIDERIGNLNKPNTLGLLPN